MSGTLLSTRNRSFSQASIRKRLLRSSSQHESQRQLVKNSTMTSFRPKLQRLIQQGKIQQIINSDKHSKANLLYTNHINQMQQQLSKSKKLLSNMTLKSKSKEFNINKLKDQIARLDKERQIIQENSNKINKAYQASLVTLDAKRNGKDIAQWTEKTYVHIKERLIKDQYFHKNMYQSQQKVLEEEKLRSNYIEKKSHEITNQTKQLEKAINSAKDISSEQTFHKNQFIDLINQERQEKQFLNELRLDKQKKQHSINQLSSWVIQKEELHKYLNILYTHRILGQIIRSKNNNLMKKYQQVQKAYMHIKSNTNIVQFDKILRKMQQQDSIYDITVKKVSLLQQELQKIQSELQQAKKQRNNILSQQGKNITHKKDYYQGIEKDNYQLILSQKEKCQLRIVKDQILKQRIIDWGNRISQKLNVFHNQSISFDQLMQLCVDRLQVQQRT